MGKKRMICLLLAAAFIAGCSALPSATLQKNTVQTDDPVKPPPAVVERSAEVQATPSPTPTATPLPTPMITDEWYVQRSETLYRLLSQNGDFDSDEAVYAAISRMEIDPTKPMIALTFDDGPIASITQPILDVLEQYGARATFFICGWRLNQPENVATIQRAVSLGCEIGNHTYAHDDAKQCDWGRLHYSITETTKRIEAYTGATVYAIRPPGGHSSIDFVSIAKRQGLNVVKWSQSGNAYSQTPEEIVENVFCQRVNGRKLQDGDIVLLHDTHEIMIDAVRTMVPMLQEQGYQLVTVWELLHFSEGGYPIGQSVKQR